jgi:hypothetical protein
MTARIAAEMSKDLRVMRFLFPGWIGRRLFHDSAHARNEIGAAANSNANNTTKLRRTEGPPRRVVKHARVTLFCFTRPVTMAGSDSPVRGLG